MTFESHYSKRMASENSRSERALGCGNPDELCVKNFRAVEAFNVESKVIAPEVKGASRPIEGRSLRGHL